MALAGIFHGAFSSAPWTHVPCSRSYPATRTCKPRICGPKQLLRYLYDIGGEKPPAGRTPCSPLFSSSLRLAASKPTLHTHTHYLDTGSARTMPAGFHTPIPILISAAVNSVHLRAGCVPLPPRACELNIARFTPLTIKRYIF